MADGCAALVMGLLVVWLVGAVREPPLRLPFSPVQARGGIETRPYVARFLGSAKGRLLALGWLEKACFDDSGWTFRPLKRPRPRE